LIAATISAGLQTPADKPEKIVGGAGIQFQPILPRPVDTSTIGEGRQGAVVNAFTEPQWRRHGIAGLLIKRIVAWSKSERLDRHILHASDDGRSLYEVGFVASNEMRLERPVISLSLIFQSHAVSLFSRRPFDNSANSSIGRPARHTESSSSPRVAPEGLARRGYSEPEVKLRSCGSRH
jgi:hypothetical protein